MGTVENKKEVWQYFFEKPKKNYNKYMFEMVEYPDYLMYDNEKVDSYKGKWNEFFGNDNDILQLEMLKSLRIETILHWS